MACTRWFNWIVKLSATKFQPGVMEGNPKKGDQNEEEKSGNINQISFSLIALLTASVAECTCNFS